MVNIYGIVILFKIKVVQTSEAMAQAYAGWGQAIDDLEVPYRALCP
jgi:hypothetical protein